MWHVLQENMIPALWIAFALYWVLAAVRQKRAKQDESLLSRLLYAAVVVVMFLLLLDKKDSIATFWVLLGLYVAFAILRNRDTKQRQSLFTRLPHVGAMIASFVLLLERRGVFWSARTDFPSGFTNLDLDWDRSDGLWSRPGHMGTFLPWCKLERNDRHTDRSFAGSHGTLCAPSSSDLFRFALAIAGTALAQGQLRGLLALALALVAWSIKARKEESWLRHEFGAQFDEHARRTGFLLPRLTRYPIRT